MLIHPQYAPQLVGMLDPSVVLYIIVFNAAGNLSYVITMNCGTLISAIDLKEGDSLTPKCWIQEAACRLLSDNRNVDPPQRIGRSATDWICSHLPGTYGSLHMHCTAVHASLRH